MPGRFGPPTSSIRTRHLRFSRVLIKDPQGFQPPNPPFFPKATLSASTPGGPQYRRSPWVIHIHHHTPTILSTTRSLYDHITLRSFQEEPNAEHLDLIQRLIYELPAEWNPLRLIAQQQIEHCQLNHLQFLREIDAVLV